MEQHRQLKNIDDIQASQATIKSLITLVWAIAITIALIAIFFKEALFIPFSLFFIFFACSLKETSRHFHNLYKGMSSEQKTDGTIIIEHSSESVDYYAEACDSNKNEIWKFEFMPLNWEPTKGNFQAKLVWIDDVSWPVLIETEEKIIYPKNKPKKYNK
jgi:hypothetical protein